MKKSKPKFTIQAWSVRRKPVNGEVSKRETLLVTIEYVSIGNTSKIKISELLNSIYEQISELK